MALNSYMSTSLPRRAAVTLTSLYRIGDGLRKGLRTKKGGRKRPTRIRL